MKIFKKLIGFILVLLLLVCGCIFYAFKIEPYRLMIKEYTMDNVNQKDSVQVKMIQFSDVHIKADFTNQDLEKVVTKINSQQPDIVIFTGDLYDNYALYNDDQAILLTLKKIQARYAKIAIWGNRDYGGGAMTRYGNIMEEAGFTVLKNENLSITLSNTKKLLFTGLDDSLLGIPSMPESITEADYRILLSHEPDTIEQYAAYDYHVALSGHSHGGQFHVPFLPFINVWATKSTALSSKYTGGMYEINETGVKKLFVNTGIGTTHISARFGVVPEISLFYIFV